MLAKTSIPTKFAVAVRRSCPLALTILFISLPARAAPPADRTAQADTRSRSASLFWIPPATEMQGLRVALQSAAPAGNDGKQSPGDRWESFTAAYLYSYLSLAGADVRFEPSGGDDDQPDTGAVRVVFIDAPPASAAEQGTANDDCRVITLRPCRDVESVAAAALAGVCRQDARDCFDRIRRSCAARLSSPESSAAKPAARSPLVAPRHQPIQSVFKKRIQSVARSIQPEGDLPPEKAAWFCDMLGRLAVSNASLVYFVPDVTVVDGTVTVGGATNAPAMVDGLAYALHCVGVKSVENRMRVLPDRDKLGDDLFGVCTLTHALTYRHPIERSVRQTQLLFGEPAYLLDKHDNWLLVQAADGYWGWVPAKVIRRMDRQTFDRYTAHSLCVLLEDVHQDDLLLPRGARLPVICAGESTTVLLPDGSTAAAPSCSVRVLDDRAGAAQRVQAAIDLLGIPYVFGGRAPDGLDCSGLATSAFIRAGLAPARDASQQAYAGTLVATWWHQDRLRAGDQVFFLDPSGKVYHTGIAIGGGYILHAAPPVVRVGSMDRGSPLYDERLDRDFFIAKRP